MAKAKKKLQRKQTLFLKQEPNSDVTFQEEPTCHVFVANGGLQNGLSRELLEHFLLTEPLMSGSRDLKELYLPAGKDYSFATFASHRAASMVVSHLNGSCVQEMCKSGPKKLLKLLNPKLLSGPPLHLYLCFVDKIPLLCAHTLSASEASCVKLPPGLDFVEEFVSADEERQLLDFFSLSSDAGHGDLDCTSKTPRLVDEIACQEGEELTAMFQAPEKVLKHRHVKHYGYEFMYSSSNVDPDSPLPGGLPDICNPLLKRMVERKLVEAAPDQLTVNHYLPGAGTVFVSHATKSLVGALLFVSFSIFV